MKITWIRKESSESVRPWQSWDPLFDGEDRHVNWVIRYRRGDAWSKWAVGGAGMDGLQECNSLKEAKALLLALLALEV